MMYRDVLEIWYNFMRYGKDFEWGAQNFLYIVYREDFVWDMQNFLYIVWESSMV